MCMHCNFLILDEENVINFVEKDDFLVKVFRDFDLFINKLGDGAVHELPLFDSCNLTDSRNR